MDFRDLAGLTGAEYLRKSRKDSESETIQEVLSKHKKELDELSIKWKLNIVDVFQEVVSGDKIDDRPEIQKLLKNVEELKYEFVLVMDLDRLGRGDMEDQGKILSAFKETDTFIVIPRKVYDLNDELDEEVSEMETFFARRELKIIKRRLNNGRLGSARDGNYIASTPPLGYTRSKENRECILIPNKDKELVQQIFNWFVNGDESGLPMGAYKIAHRLSSMNIPTPTGKSVWQPNTILKILNNECYLGRIIWTPKISKRGNQLGKRSRSKEPINVIGKHEPIIDQEIFDKAQTILRERLNPKLGIRKKFRNPFLGIGVCGFCGRHMQVKKSRDRQDQYRCVSVDCKCVCSAFKLVEEKVLLHLKDRLKELELMIEDQRLKDEYNGNKQENLFPQMIEQIKLELNQLEEQEDKLDTLLEQGVYDIDKYSKRSKKLRTEIQLKKDSLKSLVDKNNEILQKEQSLEKEVEILKDIITLYWQTNDMSERNKLIRTYVKQIIYYKDKRKEEPELDVRRKQI